MRHVKLSQVLVLGLALAGCAGGAAPVPTPTPVPTQTPTPGPTPPPLTVNLTEVPGGGRVCSDNTVNTGPAFFRVGVEPVCWPPGPDVSRAFVAFFLRPVPLGATVLSATLTAARAQIGAPYAPPGQQLLVEATPWVVSGGGLDPGDFSAANLPGTAPVAGASGPGTSLVADVAPLVQAYVNVGAATVDLRLRLARELPFILPNDLDQLGMWVLQVTFRP
ncbi:MAG: hypothetical protein QN144_12515 [Armatimonadota bacterium]|nr:hypothetical protein [Armatimonadota bacterium]